MEKEERKIKIFINGVEETAVLSDEPEETVILSYGENREAEADGSEAEPVNVVFADEQKDDGFADAVGEENSEDPEELEELTEEPESEELTEEPEPEETPKEPEETPEAPDAESGEPSDADDLFEAFLETGNADAAVRKTRVIAKKDIDDMMAASEQGEITDETLTVNKDELHEKEFHSDTIVFETEGELPESIEEVLGEEGAEGAAQEAAEAVPEEDPGYHDIDREHKIRFRKHPVLYGLAFVAAVAGIIAFMMSPFFDIKGTVVEGNKYYSAEEISNIAGVRTGENIFLHADKDALKANLLKDPYFTDVKISRRLPSTIKIKVTEREQVACIVYGNEFVVIDVNGIVLRKTNVDPKQTTLTGLTISKMTKGEAVEVEETRTLQHMLEMLASMKNGDFYFKHIEIDGRNVNAYITDMLVVKGRADELKRAVDEGDLQKVVNKLLQDDIRRGTITLSDSEFMSFSPKIG